MRMVHMRHGAPDQPKITAIVRISLAPAVDGTFDRLMRWRGDVLRYNLFADPGHTVIWGDGSRGTYAFTAKCCPTEEFSTITIYARIPAGQDVQAGTYRDTVLVLLEF